MGHRSCDKSEGDVAGDEERLPPDEGLWSPGFRNQHLLNRWAQSRAATRRTSLHGIQDWSQLFDKGKRREFENFCWSCDMSGR